MIKLNTLHRTRFAGRPLVLVAALLLVASTSLAPRSAGATAISTGPVDLFFNGTVPASDGGFYGLSQASVNAFFNAGGQSLPSPGFLFPGALSVATPDNLPVGIPGSQGGPNFVTNPSKASNDWMITANDDFDDVWLLFRGHSPNDPKGANNFGPGGYLPQNVGLSINLAGPDIWRLVTVSDCCAFPDVHYLALFLGDLTDGATIPQTIDYRVRQALMLDSTTGNFIVPQYLIGFATASVPEAGTAWLLGLGLFGLVARRARR